MSLDRWRSPSLPEAGGLAALVLLYLATVLPHLADDPIVGGDEGWIISAAARLAQDGVFGTELFRGFYGAEDRYYFNLPLHHLVLAGVFDLFGVGVAQARAVSFVFGLAVLLLTFALGRRAGGPAVGLGAAALLVLLRLNLAPFSGLTLTDLGAMARYDLAALPYALGALLLLSRRPSEPGPLAAATAGLLTGLAALTQFIGAFFLLPILLFLLTLSLPAARRLVLAAALVLGALLPFLPYAAFVADGWEEFRGQARAGEEDAGGKRELADLLSPAYYWRQLREEPDRYWAATGLEEFPDSPRDLLRRPSARLALVVLLPIAAVHVLARARGDPLWRLLALSFLALLLQLALLEPMKRFVYWVAAAPLFAVILADLGRAVWSFDWRPPQSTTLLRAVAVVVGLLFAVEGGAVAAKDVWQARDAPSYAALARRLDAALPPGASALGDNRLWPALRGRDFRSLLLLFYHTHPEISRERSTDIFGALERTGADYVLLSPLSRETLSRLTPEDAADFDRFLAERTRLVATVADPAYGPIEVYQVTE